MSTWRSTAGEIVAVCGATGSGKTSLLNLAARFYDPTAGRVLLGGIDLRELRLDDVRSAMSIVTQRPILFSIPLRDNLMIGRPDAGWDEVLAASEAAGVAAFVDDLPDGYDTHDRRARRRTCPAASASGWRWRGRCWPGRGVIVMDDPLSAVDTETERTLLRTVAAGAARAHGAGRDPAAVDGGARRPRGGAARRQRRRAGHAGGAGRAGRRLHGAVRRRDALRHSHRSGLAPPDHLPAGPPAGACSCWCWSRPARRSARPADGCSCAPRSTTASAPRTSDYLTVVVVDLHPVGAIGWVLSGILIRGLAGVGQGIVLGLRRDLFDHLTSLSLRYFSEQRAGWIIARLTSDVDALSDALSQGLPTLAANVVLLPTRDRGGLHRRLAAGHDRVHRAAAGAGADALVPAPRRRWPSSRCETGSRR